MLRKVYMRGKEHKYYCQKCLKQLNMFFIRVVTTSINITNDHF